MKDRKLIKNKCEIESCNVTDSNLLHLHHIIERTDINCSNHNDNLAILCSNCHNLVHSGRLKILCVLQATKLPNHRILVYELDGKRNLDIDENIIDEMRVRFKPKSYKIFGDKNDNK